MNPFQFAYTLLKHTLLFCTVCSTAAFAQQNQVDGGGTFEFLPKGLHFVPLKANHQEARIGVFKYFATANLKVDIGNTIDVFGLTFSSSNVRFTAGIDFMAYAFVTGAQGLRLQVDALDGFFGGNISFSRTNDANQLQGRLRILHLSAHFVDGHYNVSTKQWLDNRVPLPLTKDFGELLIAHEFQFFSDILRYYGGISYATLVRPSELRRFTFLSGFEFAARKLFGKAFDQPTNPFIANHFTLNGNPVYTGSNQTQIGVKFGDWHGKGIVLYLAYYVGNNFFSEYFDERVSIVGAGFTVDFP